MAPRERQKAVQNEPVNTRVRKQTVAGFVIFRRTDEGNKYLLLYRRGNYWNFPKGKFEEGENDLTAALRETYEETGIKPEEMTLIPEFKTNLRYNFRLGDERIYDTVVLHLAETEKDQVTIVPREHSGYAWFFFNDAMKILGTKYAGTRRVLKQAHDFLRKRAQGDTPTESEGQPQQREDRRPRRRPHRRNFSRRPHDHNREQRPPRTNAQGEQTSMRPKPMFMQTREIHD